MAKALLIVEGANLEPRFFTRLSDVWGMQVEIVSLKANIYRLYQKLKEYGFDYDVRIALKELLKDDAVDSILADKYAYTYLVFDCDVHHSGKCRQGEPAKDISEIVGDNYSRLLEMAAYFTDETDPERGRLFINYPMMEAYRDCDAFFEDAYKDRFVRYEELSDYKRIVGTRKMANRRIEELEKSDFELMMRMQLFKLSYLIGLGWQLPQENEMEADGLQQKVLDKQIMLAPQRIMSVLNTSLFMALDYAGLGDGRCG